MSTVNGLRYRDMLKNLFWVIIDYMYVSNNWFSQDGATSHTAIKTLNLL